MKLTAFVIVLSCCANVIFAQTQDPFKKKDERKSDPVAHSNLTKQRQQQASIQSVEDDVAYFEGLQLKKDRVDQLVYHGFPSWANEPGTEYFRLAFKSLRGMLIDSIPLNIERAIFLVENAYMGNQIKYKDFQQAVNKMVQFCYSRMNDLKLDKKDELAKNMVIYSLLVDTLKLKPPGSEKMITHYPLKYNWDDFDSKKDFTSHFVTTLVATNTGQCYSMPLLYLILAERLGTEAYLSYAPHHSFIKIKNDKGAWYNLELTCRYILSDYHYMNHSYIKSEAIRHKIYLTPLSKKETVASMVLQLGRYYLLKYGYDPFIMNCVALTEKYSPHDIEARILGANYQTTLTLTIARLLEARKPLELKNHSPEAYRHYERMQELYRGIDSMGYEEMPVEIYRKWMEHVIHEKEKEGKKSLYLKNEF